MTRFKYRDGRMVGGYSTEYGTFIVETHPLAFRVFKEKKSVATGRVREVCFKPVRVAPEGHVVYMEFNGMEQEAANDGKVRPFRGEVSASYDSEGHITEMIVKTVRAAEKPAWRGTLGKTGIWRRWFPMSPIRTTYTRDMRFILLVMTCRIP